MYKPALISGAFMAFIAVILGAFGAHTLKTILPVDQLLVFETGVRYQFYHSFGLLLTGIIYQSYPIKLLRTTTIFFIVGTTLFSGSLYAMTLLSAKGINLGPVGVITPLGGLFLILGWFFLMMGIIRKK